MKPWDIKLYQSVAYVPTHANGNIAHPDVERGVVSSFSRKNKVAHVKFEPQLSELGWVDTTSKRCDLDDLQPCAVSPFLVMPYARIEDLLDWPDGFEVTPAIRLAAHGGVETVDRYLRQYVKTRKNRYGLNICFLCGVPLYGQAGGFIFKQEHIRDEGYCQFCNHPGRAFHIINTTGHRLIVPNVILQFHPTALTVPEDLEA